MGTEESEERKAIKEEESHSKEEKRLKIADKESSEAEDGEKTKAEEISFLLNKKPFYGGWAEELRHSSRRV